MNLPEHKRKGILFGMLVGDALGVPYEFYHPKELPPVALLEMAPPPGFRRSHPGVPVGTWSDDGAQALALLDSLQHHPALDLADFAQRLLAWADEGKYTPDGRVFDIGLQTQDSLAKLRRGVHPVVSGGESEGHNGNGSLMRALSCLLVPTDDLSALLVRAMRQGLPTHAHVRSQACCALAVALGTNLALKEGIDPLVAEELAGEQVLKTLQEAPNSGEREAELRLVLSRRTAKPTGSGYVVDSLWSAWHAVSTSSSFEESVKKAVALGNDTDTTACIAGGLAGARWGVEAIPARWMALLQGKELANKLLHS